MLNEDWFILLVMGGFFFLVGLATLFRGRADEKHYFNSISRHTDVREYLVHWPHRPVPGALKTGGWIAIAIGLLLLVLGAVFFWV